MKLHHEKRILLTLVKSYKDVFLRLPSRLRRESNPESSDPLSDALPLGHATCISPLERKFDSTAPEWRDSQSVPILPKDSKSCAFPVEILGMILGDSFDKEGKQRGCIRSAYSCDFSHQPSPSPKVLE